MSLISSTVLCTWLPLSVSVAPSFNISMDCPICARIILRAELGQEQNSQKFLPFRILYSSRELDKKQISEIDSTSKAEKG
jgi:hypothetical protein